MLFLLSAKSVAYTFQPEFTGQLAVILSYGKIWIIIIIGSFVVMIPDFLYETVKMTYFPTPTEKVMKYVRTSGKINSEKSFTES